MSAGSIQLRRYRIARRDGASTAEAEQLAGLLKGEGALIDKDDARNPPPPEAYELPARIGHNSGETTVADNVAADQLRLFIERIERLEDEKKGIADDIRDVYAEMKATGFDVKTTREIVRLRKMEKNARDERDALLETYRAALGMDYAETPLGAAALRAVA